jgi:RNA polymerase sigma factor (sigma-70 family)
VVHVDAPPEPGSRSEPLDALYEAQRHRLLRLAHLLTGSHALAEEIVQEAFVVLCARDGEVDHGPAYARGIVVNLARKAQRRRGVEERHALRAGPDRVVLPPELDGAWAAVRRLPPDQRAVVVLRFYEDASLQDIAVLLGRPLGTVKSHLHRALRRLAKEITP